MNQGCRVMMVESTRIGEDMLFGSNVQIYDHDHEFDRGGVRSELRCAPLSIGRCANTVVTRGCLIADRSLVSANSVITRDLAEADALCAGAPARPIKRYDR